MINELQFYDLDPDDLGTPSEEEDGGQAEGQDL